MMALFGAVSSGVLMLVLVGIPIGVVIGYAWATKFGSDIQDVAEGKLEERRRLE